MPNALAWLMSAFGVAVLIVAAPLVVLLPVAVLLGGGAAGAAFIVLGLTVGIDGATKYDPGIFWVPAALSSLVALVGTIRHGVLLLRSGDLPPVLAAAVEALRHLLTLHLAFQVGLGSTFAVVAILSLEGDSSMQGAEALVVSLFSVVVFIVSATFTSYFMRSLIPWRGEHPRFSNAVAYTISTLLGLIAATYAFAAKTTFSDASNVAALLYQASVAFATVGATLVGGYIAILDKSRSRSATSDTGRSSTDAG